MTKAEFIHLLTAEGYLPHEIEALWKCKPASLNEDELDAAAVVKTAQEMLPTFLVARGSLWDD